MGLGWRFLLGDVTFLDVIQKQIDLDRNIEKSSLDFYKIHLSILDKSSQDHE